MTTSKITHSNILLYRVSTSVHKNDGTMGYLVSSFSGACDNLRGVVNSSPTFSVEITSKNINK